MLKELLTIVIPCKNEGINIYDCVGLICKQKEIHGIKIIIADNSDEEESMWWLWRTENDFKYSVNIDIIKGGYPAKARLDGSKRVNTPYILFLDADIMLKQRDLLEKISQEKNKDLITVPFATEKKWNWVFRLFDLFQILSVKLGTPFAVGGFQYWNTKSYWECGGYKPDELFGEDYSISHLVDPKKFKIYKTDGVYTSARRFENKGVFYMFWLMIKCYVNRNNPEFFKQHHNYWS
jgi:glycosyltransferase involved in cell wall biosynthesis